MGFFFAGKLSVVDIVVHCRCCCWVIQAQHALRIQVKPFEESETTVEEKEDKSNGKNKCRSKQNKHIQAYEQGKNTFFTSGYRCLLYE